MKAISIKEPWLSLIFNGEKVYETRTWLTKYRGPLLLVGSKAPAGPFSGKAACIVDLVGCREMTEKDEFLARCPIYPNAKVWVLANVRPVKPFAVMGQLGLYEIPDEVIQYE